MENLKGTKEYAYKIAFIKYPILEGIENWELDYRNGIKRDAMVEGYMKAVEQTNAKDLLEALVELKGSHSKLYNRLTNKQKTELIEYNDFPQVIKAINAINKATK